MKKSKTVTGYLLQSKVDKTIYNFATEKWEPKSKSKQKPLRKSYILWDVKKNLPIILKNCNIIKATK